MKKYNDLSDLLNDQLKDLYNAEKQQLDAFQKILLKTTSPVLKKIFNRHLEETEEQTTRLEKALGLLDESTKGGENKVMEELIERCYKMIKKSTDDRVLDAALVNSVQCINHFEITCYGTAIAYANALESKEVAELLQKTLEEEKNIDHDLTKIAMESINEKAKAEVVM